MIADFKSVIFDPNICLALVAHLQLAKVCAACRAITVPLSISELFRKEQSGFLKRMERSSQKRCGYI